MNDVSAKPEPKVPPKLDSGIERVCDMWIGTPYCLSMRRVLTLLSRGDGAGAGSGSKPFHGRRFTKARAVSGGRLCVRTKPSARA